MYLTMRYRVRDKHAVELSRQARAVNDVWNYCNEAQIHAASRGRAWPNYYDFHRLTSGTAPILNIYSDTVHDVCRRYEQSRRQQKLPWLDWRTPKSLGWVPFQRRNIALVPGGFRFRGKIINVFHERRWPEGAKLRYGSFCSDTRGRWYLNLTLLLGNLPASPPSSKAIGVDLGLKDLAVLSNGERIKAPQHFRRAESRFSDAQRANKRKLRRSLAAKIRNCRHDYLHKISKALTSEYGIIVAGDISSEQLARTRMAKSVLDAGWSTFRQMLSYKSIRNGVRYVEVKEHMTTRTCSCCGETHNEWPRGIAGLGIREWTCVACGCHHDRDVNAARNILARGLASLAEGAAKERSSQHPQGFSVGGT